MSEKPDYSKRRFLIVDDEPFMIGLIERMLRPFKGENIVKALDGGEALKMIHDDLTQVDCVISDFNMKPINGLQLLQAVRMGMNPRIPRDLAFIMLTGHGETEVVKSAIMLDVNGYLVKPVAADKLIHTLERVFNKSIEVKNAEHYRKISINAAAHINDADAKASKAWVMIPKSSPQRENAQLKKKIDQFRQEHATRDGAEGGVKIKNRRQCDLGALKAVMILAEDVEGEEGVVLLRKGARLTQGMIARLRELAIDSDSRSFVWIGDLA